MQHITMLVGINDDGDENNDVLFENRDVVSSLVVETELRVLVVTSGDHYHQLGPRDTVWGTFNLSLSQLGPGDTVWWHPDLLHHLEQWNSSPAFNSVLYLSG